MRTVAMFAALALLAACGPGAEPARGRDLYLQYGCAACHGENADGNGPAAGLSHTAPRDLTNLGSYAGANTIEGIASTIAFGVVDGRTGMPAYPDIPKAERIAIAEYIHALAKEKGLAPRVRAAWVRELIPGQDTTAAYLTIQNPSSKNVALTAVTSPSAKTIELHVMKTENDLMTMRRVERIDIPPKDALTFEPGGAHLMLIGFTPSSEVELRLAFDDGSVARVKAPVTRGE